MARTELEILEDMAEVLESIVSEDLVSFDNGDSAEELIRELEECRASRRQEE